MQRGARLLPLEGPEIERLQAKYPFLRRATIPANAYADQPRPIHTIGVDTVFICRRDLDVAVVYELTRRLSAVLPALTEALGLPELG
jgi:TRAP-type uncharacterized transport system substrate-binding protein